MSAKKTGTFMAAPADALTSCGAVSVSGVQDAACDALADDHRRADWDMTGGQMGYNSLGNIFFLRHRHVCRGGGHHRPCLRRRRIYPMPRAVASKSGPDSQYFAGMALGTLAAGLFCAICAFALGWITFGLRGPYFAIGTLGVAIAAGRTGFQLGLGRRRSGISMPNYPGDFEQFKLVVYYLYAALG